jgi:hypothetical protein
MAVNFTPKCSFQHFINFCGYPEFHKDKIMSSTRCATLTPVPIAFFFSTIHSTSQLFDETLYKGTYSLPDIKCPTKVKDTKLKTTECGERERKKFTIIQNTLPEYIYLYMSYQGFWCS